MTKKIFLGFINYLIIIGVLILILFPIYFLISISLFSNEQVTKPNQNTINPDGWNNNYYEILNKEFGVVVGYSLLLAFIVISVRSIILLLAGYGLSVMSRGWSNFFSIVFLVLMSMPEIVLYSGLYKNAVEFGLLNNASSLIPLAAPFLFSYFSLIYFKNSFQQTNEIYQKVFLIDKIKISEKIFLVYFPKLQTPLAITIIFSLIQTWNSFIWPNIILINNPIQLIGPWFKGLGFIPNGILWNQVAAGAVISMVIPLGLYLVFHKKINANFANLNR